MLLNNFPTLLLLSVTVVSECAIYTKSPIPFNKLLNQKYGDQMKNKYRPQNFVNLRTTKMKTIQNQMKPNQMKQNKMKPNDNHKEMDSYLKAYIDEQAKQKKSMKMNMNYVPDIPKEDIISENSIRTKKMLAPARARIHYYMPDQVSGEQIKYTSIIGSSDVVDPINVNTHSDIGVKFVPVYQNNDNRQNFFAYGEEYKSYTPVSEVAEETTQPPIEETTKYYNIELATDIIDENLKINDDFMQSAMPEYNLQQSQHTTEDDVSIKLKKVQKYRKIKRETTILNTDYFVTDSDINSKKDNHSTIDETKSNDTAQIPNAEPLRFFRKIQRQNQIVVTDDFGNPLQFKNLQTETPDYIQEIENPDYSEYSDDADDEEDSEFGQSKHFFSRFKPHKHHNPFESIVDSVPFTQSFNPYESFEDHHPMNYEPIHIGHLNVYHVHPMMKKHRHIPKKYKHKRRPSRKQIRRPSIPKNLKKILGLIN